jgi:maleate cis-trans isomerase
VPCHSIGYITPRDNCGPFPYQFYRITPDPVLVLSRHLSVESFTVDAARRALTQLPAHAKALGKRRVSLIVQAGVPVSVLAGSAAVNEAILSAAAESSVPVITDIDTVVVALRHLDVTRIVTANKWDRAINNALQAYLAERGISILGGSAESWSPGDMDDADPGELYELALRLGRDALTSRPDAEALFIAGGSWICLEAIPILEREFGRPVLTNVQAAVWYALQHIGHWKPRDGWGVLLGSDRLVKLDATA